MDVVRTYCKLSRIHHDFTALSLRPHYVHATSLAFSPRPYHASSTFIQSPRRLHCVLITSSRFLTRSYPVRSRFLLRPPRLIESFNHFQIKTFLQLALLSLLLFFFDPFLILVLNHSASSCCKNKILPRHEKTGFFAHAKTKAQISCTVNAQLISAFVFYTDGTIHLLSKPLSIFCGCRVRFVSDLFGNPEDRFSHDGIHIYSTL